MLSVRRELTPMSVNSREEVRTGRRAGLCRPWSRGGPYEAAPKARVGDTPRLAARDGVVYSFQVLTLVGVIFPYERGG